jgi:uncharacterized SAM-binding protein YcdF (DUF218 family)
MAGRIKTRAKAARAKAALALTAAFCLVIAGIPWGAGLVRFASAIPHEVSDPSTHTDAIVVLTGGSERLATGLQLLAENKAKRVFISGVHPAVDVGRVMKLAGRPKDELEARIDTGHGAQDTEGNAEETAAWMRRHGYRSLRLVTGSYHMPRSLLEFRVTLPEAVVIPHPVFPEHVKQSIWWSRPGTAALIISEYNKFLLSWLEHRLGLNASGNVQEAARR